MKKIRLLPVFFIAFYSLICFAKENHTGKKEKNLSALHKAIKIVEINQKTPDKISREQALQIAKRKLEITRERKKDFYPDDKQRCRECISLSAAELIFYEEEFKIDPKELSATSEELGAMTAYRQVVQYRACQKSDAKEFCDKIYLLVILELLRINNLYPGDIDSSEEELKICY